ncbi:hypothetical protein AY600_14130 [Phormidium willei BDU 130791]|nr:hypothetical protein AY600_14130 [Phormidium willei BDU 130791]
MCALAIPTSKKGLDLRPDLRAKADALMNRMISDFYEQVPFAKHLMSSKEINLEYYKRHTIEIILRLRMKRTCDALAIHYFTKNDPVLAKSWSHYAEDEMLHDTEFFVHDLAKVGVSPEEIYATEPFLSTKLLIGYYQYGLEYEGTPLALITSVYFVEYTTAKTQPGWLDNLEKSLGKEKVRGARGHVNLDLHEDHDDFVWSVLVAMIKTPEDEERMLRHLRNIGQLYVAYFAELYNATVNEAANDRPMALAEAVGA